MQNFLASMLRCPWRRRLLRWWRSGESWTLRVGRGTPQIMNSLFSLFYPNLHGSLDKYFQHLCDDLEMFAAHAGRKTVRPEDLELLMRR